MSLEKCNTWRLSGRDLDFLVETASPEVSDKPRLKHIIRSDEDFRNTFIADAKVFQRVMIDDEILLKISPHLFFEILLRKAADDLSRVEYTYESLEGSKKAVSGVSRRGGKLTCVTGIAIVPLCFLSWPSL